MTLLILSSGDVIGDVDVLLHRPASFDAVAAADTSVVAVPAARLLAAIDHGPGFAQRWLTGLAGRIASWQSRLDELLASDSRAKVAGLLVREAGGSATVELTQQGVADMLGASRTHVNRVLRDLETGGILRVGYGRITIINAEALWAQAPRPKATASVELSALEATA